jgi:thiamine kinase-like enzyme
MMKHTAEWIGRFHAINEREFHRLPHTELKSYDLDFYVGWSRRTLAIATDHLETYPWLPGVCQRFEEFAKVLIEAPRTIAHGEFYPHNVVDRMGTAVPVDWESAACAPGEIDLAALTEGWPSAIDDLCDTAYRFARWGSDCPADHQRRLAAARMYIAFRWLGDRPTQKHRDRSPARLQRLHELASTWGLL